jgi:hypothetical protein
LNAIATLLSGFQVTPQIGSNHSGDGDTRNPERPLNPAFSSAIAEGNPNQWFNPNAFILPAAGTYGNTGRGILTGPGLADLDLSHFKDLALTERLKLQIRPEFFNSLNHANFGDPERDRVLQRRGQFDGGTDHQHGYYVAPDPVRREADFPAVRASSKSHTVLTS